MILLLFLLAGPCGECHTEIAKETSCEQACPLTASAWLVAIGGRAACGDRGGCSSVSAQSCDGPRERDSKLQPPRRGRDDHPLLSWIRGTPASRFVAPIRQGSFPIVRGARRATRGHASERLRSPPGQAVSGRRVSRRVFDDAACMAPRGPSRPRSAMNAAIVDTDVVSMLFKTDPRANAFRPHLEGKLLGISFMTLAELERWPLERGWGLARELELAEHLTHYTVLPASRELCLKWAEVSFGAKRRGRPIQSADAWIAASALLYHVPLITNNRNDYTMVASSDPAVCVEASHRSGRRAPRRRCRLSENILEPWWRERISAHGSPVVVDCESVRGMPRGNREKADHEPTLQSLRPFARSRLEAALHAGPVG